MSKKHKYSLKVIIIGEPAVGKTSLVKKFVSGQFSKDYRSSIGTNIFTKQIELEDEIKASIQLWDIAGQERWVKMRHVYYRGAKGVIIVGDLTRKNTFNQVEDFWFPDVKQYCQQAPITLLANKNDLNKELNEVDVSLLGKRINSTSVFLTSAKTGENVERAFKLIAKHAIKLFNKV